jgi:hypothetical protein
MKRRSEFDGNLDLYNCDLSRIARDLADTPKMADDLEAVHRSAGMLGERASAWCRASDAKQRHLLRLSHREPKMDVVLGSASLGTPIPLLSPASANRIPWATLALVCPSPY